MPKSYVDLIPAWELKRVTTARIRRELKHAVALLDATEKPGEPIATRYATGFSYYLLTSYVETARSILIARFVETLPNSKEA